MFVLGCWINVVSTVREKYNRCRSHHHVAVGVRLCVRFRVCIVVKRLVYFALLYCVCVLTMLHAVYEFYLVYFDCLATSIKLRSKCRIVLYGVYVCFALSVLVRGGCFAAS